MNADGSGRVQITNMDSTSSDYLGEWTPQFAPDGTKCVIPYGHDFGDGATGISLVNLDNSGFTNIPTGPQHPTDDPTPWHPTPNGPTAIYWSPDGTKFAWNAAPEDDGAGSAAFCDNTGSVTLVLRGSFSGPPETDYSGVYGWFSDNATLLIQGTPSGGGTVLVKSDGTTTTTLFTDTDETVFGDEPNALSPDNTEIAYYDLSTGGLGVWDIASVTGSIIVPQATLGEGTLNGGFLQWLDVVPPSPPPPPPVVPSITTGPSDSGIVPRN